MKFSNVLKRSQKGTLLQYGLTIKKKKLISITKVQIKFDDKSLVIFSQPQWYHILHASHSILFFSIFSNSFSSKHGFVQIGQQNISLIPSKTDCMHVLKNMIWLFKIFSQYLLLNCIFSVKGLPFFCPYNKIRTITLC